MPAGVAAKRRGDVAPEAGEKEASAGLGPGWSRSQQRVAARGPCPLRAELSKPLLSE